MADTSQPTVYDYASPNTWRFNLARLPLVTWFCVNGNIPGINLGEAQYPTPMADIGITGDKLTYETLNITFLVDEELKNYRELWDWMVGIGFPKQHKQWETALSAGTSELVQMSVSPDSGARDNPTYSEDTLYSDGSLVIYNSKNNPKVELSFYSMFPTSLSGLNFSQQEADVEYLRADASFRFLYYDFKVSA